MTTTPLTTPIRDQADLARTWRSLMEPLGFASSSIWLLMIGPDDLPVAQVTQIEEAEEPPTPTQALPFADMLWHLMPESGGRWALLRSRPGAGAMTAEDRAWATALLGACATRGVPVDTMHLATDTDLLAFAPDDLIAA